MNGRRRLLLSATHGSMANALPQALGAQAAFPGRQIVLLAGNGGFTMLMGDLLTLRQHALPVKTVLFNNSLLGFVTMEQKAGGFLDTNVHLDQPGLCGGCKRGGRAGIAGAGLGGGETGVEARVRASGSGVGEHPDRAEGTRNAACDPPATGSGFTLCMLRPVLNGRGDEVLELARTNLL